MALNDADINETMAKDWETIRGKYAVEEELPAPVAEPETPQAEKTTQESAPNDGRVRNEDGTFAPKPKESAKAPEAEDKKPPEGQPQGTPEPDRVVADPARDINRAPSTWKPSARVDFEKLPQHTREMIHRREADFMAGQAQLLPDAQLGKSMREVVAPYKALIDAEAGGRPEVAFAELMKTAAILRMGTPEQKRNVVLGVARQYGVDLSQAQPVQPGQQPTPPQQTFQDPRVDQLLQQLNQERQEAAQREQQTLEASVTTWMSQVDDKGQPTHPYLQDVMAEMNALIPQFRQANPSLDHNQVLQMAYERATWGNPEIRALLQAQEAQRNGQVREADNQNRVREARRAASVNVPRRASLPSAGKPESIEKTIEATARELGLIS